MQILINGILLGAIYALLGVGMSMMFGIVKLTNLAHGEFIIMGAFGSTILSSALGINPILTLVVTVPVMFLLGMVLQSVLINRVMLRGAEPALLVTFGLSIILKDAMLLLFTADAQKIGVSYATASLNLGGISISVLNLVVFAISLITILVLTLFLRKTYMGRAIRATSDDTVAASLMGVSVKKTYGVAMGIAMACAGIGGAIMNPLGNFFIQQFGWRMTYFLMGAIALVLVLPFTLLLVRAKPADMGTLAYGEEAGESQESAAQQVLTGVPAKVALRSLSFVCIFLVAGCIAFCTAFIQLVPTFAGTVGLSAIAAFMASAVMIGNIAGKLVLGWLNDKLGPKRAALLGIAAVCASFLLLFLTALGPAAALVGAFLLGISMSLIAVSMPLIVRSAYGSRDYSQIFYIVTMAPSLVGSLGMAAIGFMYDAFGSYNPILVVGIVCCGLAGLLLIVGLASAGRLSAQVEKTA